MTAKPSIPTGWNLSESLIEKIIPEACTNRFIDEDGKRQFKGGVAELLENTKVDSQVRYIQEKGLPTSRYRVQGAIRYAISRHSGKLIEKYFPEYNSGWEAHPDYPDADICLYCGFDNNLPEGSARLGYGCGHCGNC